MSTYAHVLALSLAVDALEKEPPKSWPARRVVLVIAQLKDLANELQEDADDALAAFEERYENQ